MGRETRANRKRSARQRAVSRYGYTPIGFAGHEDVPPGAFQLPPPDKSPATTNSGASN